MQKSTRGLRGIVCVCVAPRIPKIFHYKLSGGTQVAKDASQSQIVCVAITIPSVQVHHLPVSRSGGGSLSVSSQITQPGMTPLDLGSGHARACARSTALFLSVESPLGPPSLCVGVAAQCFIAARTFTQ